MTDVEREESESGKFSRWVHIKNWISDYLKTSDIDVDGNKYVSTNVKNFPADYPDAAVEAVLACINTKLDLKLETTDLNLDGSKNVGVNIITTTEEDPDAATKNNPIYSFAYDGDGRLQYIYLEITPNIWKKTVCYTSGRVVYITAWAEQ